MRKAMRAAVVTLKWVAGVVLALVILLLALVAYGINDAECAKYRVFADAVERWQSRPDFRRIARDYCILSSDGLRTRPLGVSGPKLIMSLRSLPFLPPSLAASSTSHIHYDHFARGPLSAYLYLSQEQGMEVYAGYFEEFAKRPNLTDADLAGFLSQFSVGSPIPVDDEALASVRRLLADIGPAPLQEQGRINLVRLAPYVARTAADLGFVTSPDLMTSEQQADIPLQLTPEQQKQVFDHLDDEMKRDGRELWRTKQISDFLAGVWAQGYGPTYSALIKPTLKLHAIGRYAVPVAFAGLIGMAGVRRWRRVRLSAQAGERAVES